MREIKFKYGYSDSINTFEKAFTLEEIEQGLQFEEISDSPLLKNYKIVYKRQYTGLKDANDVEIYEGDIIQSSFKYRSYLPKFKEEVCILNTNLTLPFAREWIIKNKLYKDIIGECEVIGNIYENPDLLKG